MKAQLIYNFTARGFILLSAFSLGYVAVLGLCSPQAVMNLVEVQLTNTDAISSIRGAYGGVGISLTIALLFALQHLKHGIAFLSLFWGSYAFSRVLTWFMDGRLGDFGTQWLYIEATFCMAGLLLLLFRKKIFNQNPRAIDGA